MMSQSVSVPRIPLASLSPAEFRERFMVPNLPVLLTGAADGWRAVHTREELAEQARKEVARLRAELARDALADSGTRRKG